MKAISEEQMVWLKTNAVDVMEVLQRICSRQGICTSTICPASTICRSYEQRFHVSIYGITLKEVP